jgi:hypothetical protein
MLRIRILFDPLIRDPGWVKSQDPDPGSGMNNPDHISESLEPIFFGLKYLKTLMRIRDPGWKKFGSGINIPDQQHWVVKGGGGVEPTGR